MPLPVEVSLLPPHAERYRTDRLLDGRLVVRTPFGLNTLNRLLIEGSADSPARCALGVLLPDALPLLAFASLGAPTAAAPARSAIYYHLDLYNVETARETARRNECQAFEALCAPDVPALPEPPELALFAFGHRSETALVCEMVRQAHARLAPHGRFLAAVANPKDTWLRRQIERVFGNLSVAGRDKEGLLYSAKKKAEATTAAGGAEASAGPGHFLREIEVAFAGETLRFDSCYGVFSGDGLDTGSRALLEVLEPPESCASILDLGCGWGGIGLLAARRIGPQRLVLTDANSRAADLARRNAERHGVAPDVQVRLECDVAKSLRRNAAKEAGTYDLVLSNPPYTTEFRVIAMFLLAARLALRPGGSAWFVTKTNPMLEQRMREEFGNVRVIERRGYRIFVATKRTL